MWIHSSSSVRVLYCRSVLMGCHLYGRLALTLRVLEGNLVQFSFPGSVEFTEPLPNHFQTQSYTEGRAWCQLDAADSREFKLTVAIMFFIQFIILHTRSVRETICDTKLDLVWGKMSKSHRIRVFLATHPPRTPPKTGTSHGGLRDFISELNQNTAPPNKKWNFSGRNLRRGLVCGDYRCITREYHLVSTWWLHVLSCLSLHELQLSVQDWIVTVPQCSLVTAECVISCSWTVIKLKRIFQSF